MSPPIFGVNKNKRPNYPNRILFSTKESFIVDFLDLFLQEDSIDRKLFLATIALNKQVHAFPIFKEECDYLRMNLHKYGKTILTKPASLEQALSVFEHGIEQGYSTEAWFETIVLHRYAQMFADEFLGPIGDARVFNQVVVGLQNQIDILLLANNQALIIEIKKSNNTDNPYSQLKKYKALLVNDSRFPKFHQVHCLALLEAGNPFLEETPPSCIMVKSFYHKNGFLEFEDYQPY